MVPSTRGLAAALSFVLDTTALLNQGSYTTLDVPGATFTVARGINDSGQIVGVYGDDPADIYYDDAGPGYHGFLPDNGNYTTLDVPGSAGTRAYGINASGQIVGAYLDGGGRHGFLAIPEP
jgi:uncharacterized membrane protein